MRNRMAALLIIAAVTASSAPAQAHHIREGDVRFKVTCEYDHSAADDPIVYPNQPGASHLHDFFGRRAMDASVTTYEELLAGRTTCNDPEDLAGYWAPAVYGVEALDPLAVTQSGLGPVGLGEAVEPSRISVYFRRGDKHGDIQAYPDGLKMIAGHSHHGDESSPPGTYGWKCGEQPTQPSPPASCRGGHMSMVVEFPDCWDGSNTDSVDHRRHMAYSVPGAEANVCPTSHPVPVPKLTQYVNYPSIKYGAQITGLSSGGVETVHADFFNGWVRERLLERVQTCLNELARCDSGV